MCEVEAASNIASCLEENKVLFICDYFWITQFQPCGIIVSR